MYIYAQGKIWFPKKWNEVEKFGVPYKMAYYIMTIKATCSSERTKQRTELDPKHKLTHARKLDIWQLKFQTDKVKHELFSVRSWANCLSLGERMEMNFLP